jgi:hypothetical protein
MSGGPGTATYIAWTIPADGEVNVPLDAPIAIGLADLSDVTNLSIEVTITPSVSFHMTVVWSGNDLTVFVLHSPFEVCTLYTVHVVSPQLDPGPVANPWSFTSTCPYSPPGDLTLHRL